MVGLPATTIAAGGQMYVSVPKVDGFVPVAAAFDGTVAEGSGAVFVVSGPITLGGNPFVRLVSHDGKAINFTSQAVRVLYLRV